MKYLKTYENYYNPLNESLIGWGIGIGILYLGYLRWKYIFQKNDQEYAEYQEKIQKALEKEAKEKGVSVGQLKVIKKSKSIYDKIRQEELKAQKEVRSKKDFINLINNMSDDDRYDFKLEFDKMKKRISGLEKDLRKTNNKLNDPDGYTWHGAFNDTGF